MLDFGYKIGILATAQHFPSLIKSHQTHVDTYSFPILVEPIEDWKGDFYGWNLNAWKEGAEKLEYMGVKAITCNCGKTAVMQESLADYVNIPVFTSSILQIPFLINSLHVERKLGVVIAPSVDDILFDCMLDQCGMVLHKIERKLVIKHLNGLKYYSSQFSNTNYDSSKVENEIITTILDFINENPFISILLLECSDLTNYSNAIRKATKLPVFDYVTMINYVYNSLKGY